MKGRMSPTSRIARHATFVAALTLACACQSSSSVKRAAPRPVERFPSFPAEAVAGDVVVEARFYPKHGALFGTDLPNLSGVMPISLRVGMVTGSPSKVRFAPDETPMQLILPDGLVLRSVPASSIKTWNPTGATRALAASADAAWLKEWTHSSEQFVYFALEPQGELHVRGEQISHKRGELVRVMDIDRSLLAFDVEVDGERTPIRVGVKIDNRTKKR